MKEQPAKWKLDGCACVVDAYRYIKMCKKHEDEWATIHAQAQADYEVSSKLFDEGRQKRIDAEAAGTLYQPTNNLIKALSDGDLTSLM
jgi:hypothetical protein